MKDYSTTGNYYTIAHVVLFTGLTDRTIRHYLSSGLLKGEKINGLWHFTPEQVEAFIRHPAVRPSILAKKNGVVYDFLMGTSSDSHQICMILDLPGEDAQQVAEYFCCTISNGNFHEFHFSFDSVSGTPRVILKGHPEEVMGLVNRFYSR